MMASLGIKITNSANRNACIINYNPNLVLEIHLYVVQIVWKENIFYGRITYIPVENNVPCTHVYDSKEVPNIFYIDYK